MIRSVRRELFESEGRSSSSGWSEHLRYSSGHTTCSLSDVVTQFEESPFFLTMAIAETYIRLELRQVRAAILGICALGHIYCALPRGDQSIIGLTATNPNLSRTDFLSLLVPVTAESLSALKLSLRIPCSR